MPSPHRSSASSSAAHFIVAKGGDRAGGLLVEAPALQAAATKLGLAIPALEADGPGGGDAREDDEIPD
jgi:hypothetical protein